MCCIIDENNIGADQMGANYGAIRLLTFTVLLLIKLTLFKLHSLFGGCLFFIICSTYPSNFFRCFLILPLKAKIIETDKKNDAKRVGAKNFASVRVEILKFYTFL